MSTNPTSPVTRADLETFERRIMQQFDRISRLVHLDQVRQSFRLADRVNAVTSTAFTEGDVEQIVDDLRSEMQSSDFTQKENS